jgi:hypothetical protein
VQAGTDATRPLALKSIAASTVIGVLQESVHWAAVRWTSHEDSEVSNCIQTFIPLEHNEEPNEERNKEARTSTTRGCQSGKRHHQDEGGWYGSTRIARLAHLIDLNCERNRRKMSTWPMTRGELRGRICLNSLSLSPAHRHTSHPSTIAARSHPIYQTSRVESSQDPFPYIVMSKTRQKTIKNHWETHRTIQEQAQVLWKEN